MKSLHDAKALLPLLDSIRRELEERAEVLAHLERRLKDAPAGARRLLEAEAALQQREVARCHVELERLGCSVLGTMPLTFRIQTGEGSTLRSFVWQHGQEPRG